MGKSPAQVQLSPRPALGPCLKKKGKRGFYLTLLESQLAQPPGAPPPRCASSRPVDIDHGVPPLLTCRFVIDIQGSLFD